MAYVSKAVSLVNNYVIARLLNKPSTAQFWYLPEPANIKHPHDLIDYQNIKQRAPFYLMNYEKKLKYSLQNQDGIIVLPYADPIGQQINPEAAFQYALGLHDAYLNSPDEKKLAAFLYYADYFYQRQTKQGLWEYEFDWFIAKAPWSSALAQARGASVMLRAFLQTNQTRYRDAALQAVASFQIPTSEGGFLHQFAREKCFYFEEYPLIPTGVINGFMAALMSLWELNFWLKTEKVAALWETGIASLHKMLPHYTTKWWSLYDLDAKTPVPNVNSPRYHLLEMDYLKVLSILANSPQLAAIYEERRTQYQNKFLYAKALGIKTIRKIIYK